MMEEYYKSHEDAMKATLEELLKDEDVMAIEIHTRQVTVTLQWTNKGWTVTEE